MCARRRGIKAALAALTALLIGALATGVTCAEEAASAPHGDGKGAAAPADHGDHAPSKAGAGEGGKSEAHPSSGGDGKNPQSGSSERGEPARDTPQPAQTGKDVGDLDTHVEPVRRLDKKGRPGETNPALRTPGKEGPTRQLSPLPQAPAPARNSIGVIVPAPAHIEPREGTHLPTPAPHVPSAAAPGTPGNASARLGKPDIANRPATNPIVAPPAVSRGAINGTGVTRRNVGPPRIGGPAAPTAGINGTALRAKR